MRKSMCNRAVAIYFDYKNAKPSHFYDVIEKEILDSNWKEIILWFQKYRTSRSLFLLHKN